MYFPKKKKKFRYICLTSIIFVTCNSARNSAQFIRSSVPFLFIFLGENICQSKKKVNKMVYFLFFCYFNKGYIFPQLSKLSQFLHVD